MQRPADLPFRYDPRTIALHWAVAAIVIFLWCLGQSIDWFPKGMPRVSARSLHIVLGALLVPLLLARIAWRLGGGSKLPPAARDRAQSLASAGHVVIYVLLAVAVLLGLANAWVRGDSIFGVFSIPKFDENNKALREQVEDLHALAVNVVVGVAAAHAALAIYHHRVLRDGVLRRMLRAR